MGRFRTGNCSPPVQPHRAAHHSEKRRVLHHAILAVGIAANQTIFGMTSGNREFNAAQGRPQTTKVSGSP